MGFDWINDLIQALFSFIPRPLIIRATHGGVKWRWGSHVIELKPGVTIWWPLTTEVCTLVTARQTYNSPTQALMTKDKREVVAGGVIVYSIKDVLQAIGKRNWDVDTTVNDMTQAAIVEVVTKHTLDDLLANLCGDIATSLTRTCRKELRQFGVYVHRAAVTDFSTCRAYNMMGSTSYAPVDEEE